MAEQLAHQLAASTPTHCPAELAGQECPFGDEDCIDRADESGALVECWAAVLAEQPAPDWPGA